MKNKDIIPQWILNKPPFDKNGRPNIVTSILATLLQGIPLTKEEILTKIDSKHTGRSRGYLSNYFAELKKLEILNFDKRVAFRKWSQGKNYQAYLGFVFMELIKLEDKAVASLQYKLLPKKKENSLDFIMSPTEDIFKQPNQFLDKAVSEDYKKL